MSKTYVQDTTIVLENVSPCLSAGASIAGSAISHGFTRLVGGLFSDVNTESASGLRIEQSFDLGVNWDLISGSDLVAACAATGCSVEVVGNAVKVTIISGGSAASALRTSWRLRPI